VIPVRFNHWGRRNYAIDFVHLEFLRRYVTDHALPFANLLGARMGQYQQRHQKAQAIRPKDLAWDAFVGTRAMEHRLCVSESPLGRYWELHEVAAVGDPAHLVQIGRRHRLSTCQGQWRLTVQ
jgi:hypothetical protein